MSKAKVHSTVTVQDLGWDKILKEHKDLDGFSVEAGLYGRGDNPRSNIAMRGFINEYGIRIDVTDKMRGYLHSIGLHLKADTAVITIPSRPFMRDAFEKNHTLLMESISKWYGEVIEKKIELKTFFDRIGVMMTEQIKNSIRDGGWVSNHPITIEIKGSSRPLIDSGEMLESVKYQVVRTVE